MIGLLKLRCPEQILHTRYTPKTIFNSEKEEGL